MSSGSGETNSGYFQNVTDLTWIPLLRGRIFTDRPCCQFYLMTSHKKAINHNFLFARVLTNKIRGENWLPPPIWNWDHSQKTADRPTKPSGLCLSFSIGGPLHVCRIRENIRTMHCTVPMYRTQLGYCTSLYCTVLCTTVRHCVVLYNNKSTHASLFPQLKLWLAVIPACPFSNCVTPGTSHRQHPEGDLVM